MCDIYQKYTNTRSDMTVLLKYTMVCCYFQQLYVHFYKYISYYAGIMLIAFSDYYAQNYTGMIGGRIPICRTCHGLLTSYGFPLFTCQ